MKTIIEQTNEILKSTDLNVLEAYVKWLKEGQKFSNILAMQSNGTQVEQTSSASNDEVVVINSKRCHSGYVRYQDCMPYAAAKAYIINEGITCVKEFQEWVRNGNRPVNFPGTPEIAYKSVWHGWKDFLTPQTKVSYQAPKLSYQEAKQLMRKEGIAKYTQFRDWKHSNKRPVSFPADPKDFYSRRGTWKSWDDFFGV